MDIVKKIVPLESVPTSVKGRGNQSIYTEGLCRLAQELKANKAALINVKKKSDYSSLLQIVARRKLPLKVIKRGEDIFVIRVTKEMKPNEI